MAEVNGQALSEKEFHSLCESSTQAQGQSGTVGLRVLVQWIRNTLLAQQAKELKVYPSEKDLTARLEAVQKQAAYFGAEFEAQLKEQGMTLAAVKRDLLNDLINENVLFRDVTVSDEEVRRKFEEQKAQLTQPEQARISQITVDSEEKVKKVRDDLAAGGTNFGLVASSRSQDQFAKQNGQVPFPVARPVPPGLPVNEKVVEAAFKLSPSEVSEPVRVSAGQWVFVRLDEKIPKKEPRFEDFREMIRRQLREEKARSTGVDGKIRQGMIDATQKADIKIHRPEYQVILHQIRQSVPPAGAAAGMPPPPPGG